LFLPDAPAFCAESTYKPPQKSGEYPKSSGFRKCRGCGRFLRTLRGARNPPEVRPWGFSLFRRGAYSEIPQNFRCGRVPKRLTIRHAITSNAATICHICALPYELIERHSPCGIRRLGGGRAHGATFAGVMELILPTSSLGC